jgi:phosphoserine phosphatase
MRISFDLDDTLICLREGAAHEPRLPWPWRMLVRDEPLRLGARRLLQDLRGRGHDVWIHTTSHRSARACIYTSR